MTTVIIHISDPLLQISGIKMISCDPGLVYEFLYLNPLLRQLSHTEVVNMGNILLFQALIVAGTDIEDFLDDLVTAVTPVPPQN